MTKKTPLEKCQQCNAYYVKPGTLCKKCKEEGWTLEEEEEEEEEE